jgi:hypothetical protein
MSSAWRSQVNQKLYFAQLLTDAAADAGTEHAAAKRTALLEGAVFHLVAAYRLYLREIAAYQQQAIEALDARSARAQLAGQGFVCQELDTLALLEENGQWPARLLLSWRRAAGELPAATGAKNAVSGSTLVLADVTDIIDAEVVRDWLECFQALIDTQRQSSEEW